MSLDSIKLFHLHFFCKDIEEYEKFLMDNLGFNLLGRYSVKDGLLPDDMSWEKIKTDKVRLRLVELQKAAVNIVLMPGKFEQPKLEHFGFLLNHELFEHALLTAKELGLSIQERPKRTFISSKLGFRLEIHKNTENNKVKEEDYSLLSIKKLSFMIDQKDEFFSLLKKLFNLDSIENSVQVNGSKIEVESGSFALKSFELAGEDRQFNSLNSNDIPANFQLVL